MLTHFLHKANSLGTRLCPLLPGPWQLPYLCALMKGFTHHEREAFNLAKIGPSKGVAIDIGANFGLYSWHLAKLYSKVIAFEPNPAVARTLIAAKLQNVHLIHEGVSSGSGEAKLCIPYSKGLMMAGWASLNPQNLPGADRIVELPIHLNSLDSHQFKDVKFIKIDVEGHEIEVLKGAEQTIRSNRPHMIIETLDDHLTEVRNLLRTWQYQETSLQSLGGPPGSEQNLIFLPK
jgi:FkbM family methyltransferase